MKRKVKSGIKKIARIGALLALVLIAPYASDKLHRVYLYEFKGDSVVMVEGKFFGRDSGGTGFQVEYNGKKVIMTNLHVCQLADENGMLTITDQNRNVYVKKVLKLYDTHDLCLVEPIIGLPALKLAGNAHKHEPVHLIGHPRLDPLTMQSGFAVEKVVIDIAYIRPILENCFSPFAEERGKEIPVFFLPPGYKACIESLDTVHINVISYGGNSGSPVLDDFGNVVGVLFAGNRAALTASYIVPLEYVRDFLSTSM